jgi:hypothetical protein
MRFLNHLPKVVIHRCLRRRRRPFLNVVFVSSRILSLAIFLGFFLAQRRLVKGKGDRFRRMLLRISFVVLFTITSSIKDRLGVFLPVAVAPEDAVGFFENNDNLPVQSCQA